ncbi:OLC1v1007173C1 [Oldenlandia corymbosa var. corymbosa]|uniref:OLC1v1007173C1 n=1 Tax=Oldenlandia corymbosa var. corymbosa TaxID=529605 RepID=A0AAV1DJ29_OLDCO|nr:OLC1v1007173C1 [Oldenlandia corymbosa var. corymbosa]
MEASLSIHHTCRSLITLNNHQQSSRHRHRQRPSHRLPFVLAVLSQEPPRLIEPSTSGSKSVYHDNWYDRIAINHLSQNFQTIAGTISKRNGYDGLVEAAGAVYRKFTPTEQGNVVIQTLEKAFPRPILSLIKLLLPQSQFAREYFALFTTVFFAWLIGPCEVKESEFEGRQEKNVVHIKKCRFLEGTNCVGMCTNLCKMPSQVFIKDSLGMPLNMVPNFEDMSCEMIFGEEPPLRIHDPAFTQPCFKLCKASESGLD